jgi:hypothetical protein
MEIVNCAMLNEPIGDLEDTAYSPGSREHNEDVPSPLSNWQSISVWDDD